MKRNEAVFLLLLTLAALFIHGYHPWVEDAEIYLPGVEKILHPQLFPFNTEFFQSHANLTLFPNLVAASVRVTHLPLDYAIFLWQLASIFLFLLACLKLSGKCSADPLAQWSGVTLIAALLTLPVAGTALYLMDQYINPRNLVASVAILSVIKMLDKKYLQAGLLLAVSALIHPLMSSFAISFCVLLQVMKTARLPSGLVLLSLLPFGISLAPASAAYHQAALSHTYECVTHWAWYEWLGGFAPLVFLWFYTRIARAKGSVNMELMCRTLIVYQLLFIAAALALDIPARFEALARLQPMRSLYLLYVLFLLLSGILLGEYVLKKHIWRWLLLFIPLCIGMFAAQCSLFPASPHIEWPWAASKNAWVQAFEWVRDNTPASAEFALDPFYLALPGEDENGFRVIAERGSMADAVKDSGVVTMFPDLADEWWEQVQATANWRNFRAQDFERLRERYHVTWVVLQQPGTAGLECPYRNATVVVCRLE